MKRSNARQPIWRRKSKWDVKTQEPKGCEQHHRQRLYTVDSSGINVILIVTSHGSRFARQIADVALSTNSSAVSRRLYRPSAITFPGVQEATQFHTEEIVDATRDS